MLPLAVVHMCLTWILSSFSCNIVNMQFMVKDNVKADKHTFSVLAIKNVNNTQAMEREQWTSNLSAYQFSGMVYRPQE